MQRRENMIHGSVAQIDGDVSKMICSFKEKATSDSEEKDSNEIVQK